MFSIDVQEEIALETISLLVSSISFVPTYKHQASNAPFYNSLLEAVELKNRNGTDFRLDFEKINSTLHKSFLKKIAHIFSGGDERELSDLNIDVFIQDDTKITVIQLETDDFFARTMLEQRQILREIRKNVSSEYSNKQIDCYLGIPFDPYSTTPTGYDKTHFLNMIVDGNKYFAPEEVLLSSELWDFLSGEKDTMQQILDIINAIATPQFMKNYFFLKDGKNRKHDEQEYKVRLKNWFLFSELELLEKATSIEENLAGKKKRIYNQSMFTTDGEYKWERYRTLIKLAE